MTLSNPQVASNLPPSLERPWIFHEKSDNIGNLFNSKKKIILTFNFQIHFTFRQITNFSFKSSDFTIFSILISRFNLKMIPVLHEFHSLNLMKPQQSCNYTRDFSRQITNFSFKFSDFTIFSISNFQIHFENDPGAALVSFAQPNEATAAMQLYARFFWSNHKFQF